MRKKKKNISILFYCLNFSNSRKGFSQIEFMVELLTEVELLVGVWLLLFPGWWRRYSILTREPSSLAHSVRTVPPFPEDGVESFLPAANRRLQTVCSVLPQVGRLDTGSLSDAGWAGRGGWGQEGGAVVRGHAEGMGGAGRGEGGGGGASQFHQAGALLQASTSSSSSSVGRALILQEVEVGPGVQKMGPGVMQSTWFAERQSEGGVRVWAAHDVPERRRRRWSEMESSSHPRFSEKWGVNRRL